MISNICSFKCFPKMSTDTRQAFFMVSSSGSSFGAMMYAIDAPMSTFSNFSEDNELFQPSAKSPVYSSFGKTPTTLPFRDDFIIFTNFSKFALSLSFCLIQTRACTHFWFISLYYTAWNMKRPQLTRSRTRYFISGSFASFSLGPSACFKNSIFFLLAKKYAVSGVKRQMVSLNWYPNSQTYTNECKKYNAIKCLKRNIKWRYNIVDWNNQKEHLHGVILICCTLSHHQLQVEPWYSQPL